MTVAADPMAALDTAESSLQAAILANDPVVIGGLLHERAVYVGPDGSEVDRDGDLGAYRPGTLRIERYAQLARHTAGQAVARLTSTEREPSAVDLVGYDGE